MQRLKEERLRIGGDGLMLDAGDAVGSGNITFRPGGEPILDHMNWIGYDAMTVGNREFHFSRIGFQSKVKRAAFPVLCANVHRSDQPVKDRMISSPTTKTSIETESSSDCSLSFLSNHLLLYASGLRVAIFGLTVPMITRRMLSRSVSAFLFEDPIETAQRIVASLRAALEPDLLIALTHIGIHKDRALAAAVPEIDLIIGGHTHVVLETGERVGDTLIVQAGSHGRYLGRVEIEPAAEAGKRLRMSATLEAL